MFLGNKELELDLEDDVVSILELGLGDLELGLGDLEQLGSSSWIVGMVRLVSASYCFDV